MDGAFADLIDDVGDMVRVDAVFGQPNSAIDEGLAHGTAVIGLEGEPRHLPGAQRRMLVKKDGAR